MQEVFANKQAVFTSLRRIRIGLVIPLLVSAGTFAALSLVRNNPGDPNSSRWLWGLDAAMLVAFLLLMLISSIGVMLTRDAVIELVDKVSQKRRELDLERLKERLFAEDLAYHEVTSRFAVEALQAHPYPAPKTLDYAMSCLARRIQEARSFGTALAPTPEERLHSLQWFEGEYDRLSLRLSRLGLRKGRFWSDDLPPDIVAELQERGEAPRGMMVIHRA